MTYYQQPPIIQTAEVTLTPGDNGTLSQALVNNTLYTVAASAVLTYLSIMAATGLKYCGFDFATGATAPTFAYPAGWLWTGYNCANGIFVPQANRRYRCAIEQYGDTYIDTVQQVPSEVAE